MKKPLALPLMALVLLAGACSASTSEQSAEKSVEQDKSALFGPTTTFAPVDPATIDTSPSIIEDYPDLKARIIAESAEGGLTSEQAVCLMNGIVNTAVANAGEERVRSEYLSQDKFGELGETTGIMDQNTGEILERTQVGPVNTAEAEATFLACGITLKDSQSAQ